MNKALLPHQVVTTPIQKAENLVAYFKLVKNPYTGKVWGAGNGNVRIYWYSQNKQPVQYGYTEYTTDNKRITYTPAKVAEKGYRSAMIDIPRYIREYSEWLKA